MNCPHCHAINDADATFCMTCGQSIPQPARATAAPDPYQTYQGASSGIDPFTGQKTSGLNVATAAAPAPATNGFASGEVLVLREEKDDEGHVQPNQRRPLIVQDEQMTHLANTDRRLGLSELLDRVKSIIDLQQVPVDVQAVNARWLKDEREVRPRIVASLRNHSFSDIKMVLGVDYLGRWASIKLYVGWEPDPIPSEPTQPAWSAPLDGIIALFIGGLLFIFGPISGSTAVFFLSFLPLIYGGARMHNSYKLHLAKITLEKAKHFAEQEYKKMRRKNELRSRTFKKDDMYLFCTAMRQVFQVVVDDIVERGAKVVRVKGGGGGFFEPEGVEQGPRISNAAEADV